MGEHPEGTSSQVQGEQAKSREGLGRELLDDDEDGRLTMEIVSSMHEVRLRYLAHTRYLTAMTIRGSARWLNFLLAALSSSREGLGRTRR